MNDTTDYYATETIELNVKVRVSYRRGDDEARKHIKMSAAESLRLYILGCSILHGAYEAKLVEVRGHEETPGEYYNVQAI